MNTRAGRLAWGIFALTIFLIAVAAAIFVYDVAVSGHQPDPNYLGLRIEIPIFAVEDDGKGFDAATVRRGAGLTNMTDRLDALGGHIGLDSKPGSGTRLQRLAADSDS